MNTMVFLKRHIADKRLTEGNYCQEEPSIWVESREVTEQLITGFKTRWQVAIIAKLNGINETETCFTN